MRSIYPCTYTCTCVRYTCTCSIIMYMYMYMYNSTSRSEISNYTSELIHVLINILKTFWSIV